MSANHMSNKDFDCDVVIVGAGLSGLASADLLYSAGLKVIVLEAQSRVGGRIHSVYQAGGVYAGDLGPTWVWPLYQPIVARWLDRLGVDTFSQFEDGDAILDLSADTPAYRQMLPGQHGSRRLNGGSQALIDALMSRLPPGIVKTDQTVTNIALAENPDSVAITVKEIEAHAIKARRVIVAVPLRIAAQAISWSPDLGRGVLDLMQKTPTWMAAQAKAVIAYERAFWKDEGLSGRVASQAGPLVEVHDHSVPGDDGQAALFGFIGWPPPQRKAEAKELRAAIAGQLKRCFGEWGARFTKLTIEDWALNRDICAKLDLASPPEHPLPAPDILREGHYGGRLFFAVSETAAQSPGLIEGAFAAAEDIAGKVISACRSG